MAVAIRFECFCEAPPAERIFSAIKKRQNKNKRNGTHIPNKQDSEEIQERKPEAICHLAKGEEFQVATRRKNPQR
jgi:hypothetical protein